MSSKTKTDSKPANIEQLDTWVKFRKNLCKDCWGACCTMPVEVSAADLMRLGLLSEDEAASSLKKAARRLSREGWIRDYRPMAQLFVLEQRNGRDCIFLGQDRLCKVYEKRPEVCRQFPKIGPKPGSCPYRKK